MCYDSVQLLLHTCGHQKPSGRVKVDCHSRRCRYSDTHPASGCNNCVNTCRQWMLQAQTVPAGNSPTICWDCAHPPRR
ncbi:hypothetical protein B0H19DRAFT_1144179 [Mycena capillaripes]|nr:hypothetical protein B0H19DRAFT_1144179 [Mycena capillaripes]